MNKETTVPLHYVLKCNSSSWWREFINWSPMRYDLQGCNWPIFMPSRGQSHKSYFSVTLCQKLHFYANLKIIKILITCNFNSKFWSKFYSKISMLKKQCKSIKIHLLWFSYQWYFKFMLHRLLKICFYCKKLAIFKVVSALQKSVLLYGCTSVQKMFF